LFTKRNRNKHSGRGSQNAKMILYKGPDIKITRRICTFAGGTISTTAGNLLALNTCSNDTVRTIGSPEFASYSARFMEFRVRRVTNRYMPTWAFSNVFGNDASHNHGVVYAGTFYGGAAPANGQGLLSSTGGKACTSCKEIVIQADWNQFPNGKLWTPIGSAINAANVYGVGICGPVLASSTFVASTDYFNVVNEWDVEFCGDA